MSGGVFQMGDRVEKVSGSSWRGKVVGTYSTALTPEGYCVESETETGSVQIYPVRALRLSTPTPPIEGRDADVERVEKVARAICKARGWNPDTCIFGSSGLSGDGEAISTCHAWMWQNCVPDARAALQALGERG